METHFTCSRCHETKPVQTSGPTGYALRDNEHICYACCADIDRAHMIEHGRITLYLTMTAETASYGRARIANWPGTLQFSGRYSKGKHNMARVRYDAEFVGPDGHMWTGTQYGDNTQIIHCRRTKRKARA